MEDKKTFTREQSLEKIKYYCAYQERCHQEVKDKLYSFGLHRRDVDEILSDLITTNFLNEERFALQYAGGKFRMKHWGKNKIRQQLLQRGITTYVIGKALKSIDSFTYENVFEREAERKWDQLKGERNIFIKKKKLKDYMLQKGFESSLIFQWLAKRTSK